MRIKYIIQGFIICLLCFAASSLQIDSVMASERVDSTSYTISDFQILEDPAGSYSFEEISAAEYASQYREYQGEAISLGITKAVYWIRFRVPNFINGENDGGKFLQIKNANLDKIDIYIPKNKKDSIEDYSYSVKKVGVSRPNSNRDIIDNTWVFQLPKEWNDQEFIYLRLESTSALRVPVICWSPDSFIADSFLRNMGFGAFYGTLLVMLVFNLFLYTVLRDKAYLYYVFIPVSGSRTFQDAT
jgi:two-component system, sensor histidine kinase LadS